MSGNPHYAAAESCLNSVAATSGAEFAAEYRQLAGIEASLAIAWEQRTANLIALFGKTHPNGSGAFPHPLLEAAQRELQERLGL